MTISSNENKPKNIQVCVVMRGTSAAIFDKARTLNVNGVPSELGPINIVYRSRWIKKSDDVSIPGNIWIEIRGTAPDLETAIPIFANSALQLLPWISVAFNTAIFDPDVEVAFDTSISAKERAFFQTYLPPELQIPYSGRVVDESAMAEWIPIFTAHPEYNRLTRAANQYNLALRHWKYGHATLSLAHLWMAVEALTEVKIKSELTARNLSSKEQLCDALAISQPRNLEATIRKDFLLHGNDKLYKEAKSASDGFEHGYLGFDKVAEISKRHRNTLASYVRSAILELAGVNSSSAALLLTARYNEPKGYWPIVKNLRGTLIADHDNLHQAGSEYPFFHWRPEVQACEVTDDRKLEFTVKENITAEIGEGVSFQPKDFEIWEHK